VHLMTSLCLPLVVSSVASMGDLDMVSPGLPWPAVAPLEFPMSEETMSVVREVLGADGASSGAVGIEVDGAGPQPSDDFGGLL
jgi:hypothetical protein